MRALQDALPERRLRAGLDFGMRLVGRPPVTLTENADEVGPASLDLFEDDRQNPAFRFLLVGSSPAQVNLGESYSAFVTQVTQGREDAFDEDFALFVHVAKRGRDEDADRPVCWRCGLRGRGGTSLVQARFGCGRGGLMTDRGYLPFGIAAQA